MTKDVLITIEGLQFEDNASDEVIEVITPGTYYKKNNRHFVLYDEVSEGSNDITKNTIRFDNEFLSLTKHGFANVEMVFEKNKRNMTNYVTPYGTLLIGINASNVNIIETEDNISIDIDYSLDINYEHLAECKIKMSIKSVTEENIKNLKIS